MDVASLLQSPAVFVAVFAGAGAALLFYILRVFREGWAQQAEEDEPIPVHHGKKPVTKPKKKHAGPKPPSTSTSTQTDSRYMFRNCKGHTGQVHHADYSSNGKYLATCAEGTFVPPPSPSSSTSSSCSSSGDSFLLYPEEDPPEPPSMVAVEPAPCKGLTRRQRKNRRREDSPPEFKKRKWHHPVMMNRISFKYDISETDLANYLYPLLLTYEQQFTLGYPVVLDSGVCFFSSFKTRKGRSSFDVNAREFVPRKKNEGGQSDGRQSDDSSEEELYRGKKKEDEGFVRKCVRCENNFFITKRQYLTQERCRYHWGKLHKEQYTCCGGEEESEGCTDCKLHVWSGYELGLNGPLEGYVKTSDRRSSGQGVYALDCEMCYTVAGLEVVKVTVVAIDGKVVYDTYVKPATTIIDYNTRFSGITPHDLLVNKTKTLKQVQNDLKSFITAETILIGHALENDMRALKMVHNSIVDTASCFPHWQGLPYRRSLKNLAYKYLAKEIQCGRNGHNSIEDACASLELMLYKYRKENIGLFV